MTTISQAKESFGDIKVGQFVAYWVSDDGQASMLMGAGDTEEAARQSAAEEIRREGVEGGCISVDAVTE